MKKLVMLMVVLAVLAVLLVAVVPVGALPLKEGLVNEDPPQPGGSPGQTPHDGPPGWSLNPGQGGNGP